ncbi:unnamed protein product [Albugo candida]|uniref:Uncharacterized protein n=1 Tax=Albugo candida TaxID=65357 RepID=A0A024G421_9STRA|nr:unnamed protein product [Albugo candida]|eukprot:CCI41064.1 unnamed protein product [Albugo candida]
MTKLIGNSWYNRMIEVSLELSEKFCRLFRVLSTWLSDLEKLALKYLIFDSIPFHAKDFQPQRFATLSMYLNNQAIRGGEKVFPCSSIMLMTQEFIKMKCQNAQVVLLYLQMLFTRLYTIVKLRRMILTA